MTEQPLTSPAHSPKPTAPRYIDSEHYRQMLVRDGERRFREWHGSFLRYQQQFLQAMRER